MPNLSMIVKVVQHVHMPHARVIAAWLQQWIQAQASLPSVQSTTIFSPIFSQSGYITESEQRQRI